MRRIAALLLLLFVAATQVVAAQTEDFEAESVGAQPNGWYGDYKNTTTAYSKVVSQDNNRYLAIFDSDTGTRFVEHYFERQEGRFILEADFMVDAAYPDACIIMAIRTWDDNSAIYVEFKNNSITHITQDDGKFLLAPSITPNRWTKCKFDIDLPARYFNFYLDDTLTASRVPFRKKFASNLSTLQMTSQNVSNGQPRFLAIDNLKIEPLPRQTVLTVGSGSAYVNGVEEKIDESDSVVPYIEGDRAMVPLRFIAQAFGAKVYYDEQNHRAECLLGDRKITNVIGTEIFEVNGESVAFDAASCVVDGRTMVPIRVFAEAFLYETTYLDGQITITAS